MGQAETAQIPLSQFESVRHTFAFADRKKSIYQKQELSPFQKIKSQTETNQSNTNRAIKSPEMSSYDKSQPTKPKKLISSINLEMILQLADCGELSEADQLCETYIKQNSTNVKAYVLPGEIYQAQSKEKQAQQCFQKAIYLQPNYYEALIHLTLLVENRGDIAKAAVLRQRIQRLQDY